MNRKYRLSTALDIDDLLMECVAYAIRLANEKYKFDPPLSMYEMEHWGRHGTRIDCIFEFFRDPEFYRTQPVIQGAKEFVRKLSTMTEVFVSTAIPPEFMGIRAQRILEEFPEIPADHIYMGSRKDKIDVDILFDDGLHNVSRSNAPYPILMRRPWNMAATGMLAVNTYNEFLKLVEVISDSYSIRPGKGMKEPGIVVLVGPSGSGKTEVAKKLMRRKGKFEKLISYTTDASVGLQGGEWYKYITLDAFRKMCENGELFESTMYAGHNYGSRKGDIEEILAQGKHVLTVMDICGAMSLKTHFPNVTTVYIKRDKRDLLKALLQKNLSDDETVSRLLALDYEMRNADICDYTVSMENGSTEAAQQIVKALF
jgi:guanylate kinase